jgi:putative FmdB family regulatory protein
MPTYEYACTDCGTHVEVVQSMSAEPLTTCSVCGGRLRKVFSPIGVVFKGSGFYRTDSRASARAADGGTRGKEGKESKKADSASSSDGASSKPKTDGKSGKASEKSA